MAAIIIPYVPSAAIARSMKLPEGKVIKCAATIDSIDNANIIKAIFLSMCLFFIYYFLF